MMAWWSDRAPRERLLLGAALAAALLAGLVQFVLLPSFQRRDEAAARAAEAASTLVRLERLRASGNAAALAAPPADADAEARALAAEFGLAPAPVNDASLSFTFTMADPQGIFAWASAAKMRLGLSVERAALVAAGPGTVNAEITLTGAPAP